MEWLRAWWQQIVGPPHVNPWDDDPRIVAERKGQHERINKTTGHDLHDQWNARVRESWRPERRPDAR